MTALVSVLQGTDQFDVHEMAGPSPRQATMQRTQRSSSWRTAGQTVCEHGRCPLAQANGGERPEKQAKERETKQQGMATQLGCANDYVAGLAAMTSHSTSSFGSTS